MGLKNERLRDFGVINRLLTGYQQVINRNVDNFWGGGWRVLGCVRTGLAPASERRRVAGLVAAWLAPDGSTVG